MRALMIEGLGIGSTKLGRTKNLVITRELAATAWLSDLESIERISARPGQPEGRACEGS